MKTSEKIQPTKIHQLRLIHGGAPSGNVNAPPGWQAAPESQTPHAAGAERLRHAILSIVVEEFGQTIDEVLRELNQKFYSERLEDHGRYTILNHNLGQSGLRYTGAPAHLDLDCEGYLILSDVRRLLARFPALSPLRPEQHEFLTIGELPPFFRRELSSTAKGVVSIRSANSRHENGKQMVSVTGYFDVAEASVWGRESNRLRHAILQLKLEEAHNSVQQALEDLCVLAEPQTSDEHERKAVLRHALESVGLTFCQDHELPIPGYLSLSWPDRLFRVYPQLGALHPLAWHMLHVA